MGVDPVDARWIDGTDKIEFAREKLCDQALLGWDDAVDHAVEVGEPGTVIVGIPLEGDLLLRGVVGEAERAAAEDVLAPIGFAPAVEGNPPPRRGRG